MPEISNIEFAGASMTLMASELILPDFTSNRSMINASATCQSGRKPGKGATDDVPLRHIERIDALGNFQCSNPEMSRITCGKCLIQGDAPSALSGKNDGGHRDLNHHRNNAARWAHGGHIAQS